MSIGGPLEILGTQVIVSVSHITVSKTYSNRATLFGGVQRKRLEWAAERALTWPRSLPKVSARGGCWNELDLFGKLLTPCTRVGAQGMRCPQNIGGGQALDAGVTGDPSPPQALTPGQAGIQ